MNFKEFSSNPITALLFMAVTALGVIYYQHVDGLKSQINDLKTDVNNIKSDYKELHKDYISTLERIANLENKKDEK
jgi:hypothetical protein